VRNQLLKLSLLSILLSPSCALAEQICSTDGAKTMPDERYVLFGDDFYVRDRVTGLEWTRCAAGQVWAAKEQTCKEAPKKQVKSWFNYDAALSQAKQRYDNGQQWRVPTINELMTIIEHRCEQPAINEKIFPNTANRRFWTSSTMIDNDHYAWTVDFSDGQTASILKTISSNHLRFVRGNRLLLNKPKTESELLQEDLKPWNDGIHDLENPDLTTLLPYKRLIDILPKDSSGHPDWAESLNSNAIKPRANVLAEQAEQMVVWQHDILYKDTATMPWVLFPHKTHSQWLACANCHDAIFNSDGERADISMSSIYTGNHCGSCHGKVAFNVHTCERCHSVPHENVGSNGLRMLESN